MNLESGEGMNNEKEILRLMNDYCYLIDAGDLEGFARLFEHGSFHVLGDPSGPDSGFEEVFSMLQNVILYDGKPNTKHVMSNVQIDVDEAGEQAAAQCYITVFQALPPEFQPHPIFIGHYWDKFEKVDSAWRFKQRDISPDLMGDLSYHRSDMA
jgi:hypothetical protein